MDYSTDAQVGQPLITVDQALVGQIAHVCDIMQMLRAWWEHFEISIDQVDPVASVKAYDLMVEGVTTSRVVAKSLGLSLLPTAGLDWGLTPRLNLESDLRL